METPRHNLRRGHWLIPELWHGGLRWLCLFWTTAMMAHAAAADPEPSVSAPFYDPDVVQEIRVTIEPADLLRMRNALPERVYVPGTLQWNGLVLRNIGIRYKGDSSSSPDQRHKRGYLIKINEYEKGARFLGLRRISLDNGIQFGGLFSEPIITKILRERNIPASRCNYARLYLNDRYQGVYVNVERIDESFIKSRFGSPIGQLYKVEGGPASNLGYVGNDPANYRNAFEPKTDQADQGYAELIKFIGGIAPGDSTVNAQPLESMFALDDFLQTMAVMLYAGAFDQLTGWSPHNYYLYRHPKTGRWHFIPWDLDVGFADHAFGKVPVIDGWNAAWPIPEGPSNPLLERIVDDPALLARYRVIADRILEDRFRPEQLHPKLDALHARIANDLSRDPHPPGRITVPTDRSHADVIKSIKSFIESRYALARSQLDNPGSRPPRTRPTQPDPENQSPRPGTMDGAPSNLKIVRRDSGGIQLTWKDNAHGEIAHIVQRTDGTASNTFFNHIGMQGDTVTGATDTAVAPGATYRYRVYVVFPTRSGPGGSRPSDAVTSAPPPR